MALAAVATVAGALVVLVAAAGSRADAQVSDPPGLAELDRSTSFAITVPGGLAHDPQSGQVHLTDGTSDKINIFDGAGNLLDTYGDNVILGGGPNGTPLPLLTPGDIAIMDDSIYVVYFDSDVVVRYDRTTYARLDYRVVADRPIGLEAVDGKVYVAFTPIASNTAASAVEVYEPNLQGAIVQTYRFTRDACTAKPRDVEVHDGRIYILSSEGCGPAIGRNIGILHQLLTGSGESQHVPMTNAVVSMDISPQGQIWVAGRPEVTIFDTAPISLVDTLDLPDETTQTTDITVHPSGATAWMVKSDVPVTLYSVTGERCSGVVPTALQTDGTTLVLYASGQAGQPPDSGAASVECSNDGPCRHVGPNLVASTQLSQGECDFLFDLYQDTNGPQWGARSGWAVLDSSGPASNPCTWSGVSCDLNGIINLNLNANGLTGQIPTSIGNLVHLRDLLLQSNMLSGPIPASIGDLEQLDFVAMSGNELSGPLPATIGELANLTHLWLWDNDLTGPIPNSLGNLPAIREILIRNNNLTGSIPSSLGAAQTLTNLVLENNQLTGPIPATLGSLTDMTFLDLSGNSLSGPIPSELRSLSQVTWFDLSQNELSGAIPAELSGLTAVELLNLSQNSLSGALPRQLGSLSELTFLNLRSNGFSGVIPREIMQLQKLNILFLASAESCLLPEDSATDQFIATRSTNDHADLDFGCRPRLDQITYVPPATVQFDVLANDRLPRTAVTSLEVSGASHGSLRVVGDRIEYAPKITSSRTDDFSYEVCAGDRCFEAEILVSITPPTCRQFNGSPISATTWGTNGPDVITVGAAFDVIVTFGGDDVINAGGGRNIVCAGDGDDTIVSGNSVDYLYGGNGDDTIMAGAGIDRIWGQAGHDVIHGDGGSDRIFGGSGNDLIMAGSGADRVRGGAGNDTLRGMGGQDFMWGGHGNDELQGNWQSDRLYGGAGDDVLRGAQGKDKLYGQDGDDELYGGDNTDYLNGGAGVDYGDGQKGKDNPLVVGVSGCHLVESRRSC